MSMPRLLSRYGLLYGCFRVQSGSAAAQCTADVDHMQQEIEAAAEEKWHAACEHAKTACPGMGCSGVTPRLSQGLQLHNALHTVMICIKKSIYC